MSFETVINARLRALCDDRAWPDFRPPDVPKVYPFCTYQQIGGQVFEFLENSHPGTRNARMQVNVWGTDRLTVNALMREIEEDFLGTELRASAIGALTSLYDPAVKLYGARQDFSVTLDDD